MQEINAKTARGGRREGAGRPQGRKDARSITLRIPQDVADILEGQASKTAYVIEAIRAFDREKRKKTILGFEISYTKEKD